MLKTYPFDAARYIKTIEDAAAMLDDALGSGDAEYISHALGIILRADIAGLADVMRDLPNGSQQDGPTLSTLAVVAKALGLTMSARRTSNDGYGAEHLASTGASGSARQVSS